MISISEKIHAVLRVLLIVTVAASSISIAHAGLPSEIAVSVTPNNSEYGERDKVMLDVTYTNNSNHAVRVLRWETVLDGRIDLDLLDLEFEGRELPYIGRIYKRARPTSDDYFEMLPGALHRKTVDISTAYDLKYKGLYTFRLKGAKYKIESLMSKAKTFTLTQDRPILFKQTPSFSDGTCSPDRQVEIDIAVANAERLARLSRDDLRSTPVDERPNAQRYKEWFGGYTAGRWNTVQSHFDLIYGALSGRVLGFSCDDSTGAFAYVFVNDAYNITVGRAFWNAPRIGTDSKAGTIIHELSHFNVVAGTDDHVYGQSGARSLAKSNPTRAIDNADSHEYFSENTPFLSMPAAAIGGDDDSEQEPEAEPEAEALPLVITPILPLLLDD